MPNPLRALPGIAIVPCPAANEHPAVVQNLNLGRAGGEAGLVWGRLGDVGGVGEGVALMLAKRIPI